ncbi:MAG: hypothetical protein R2827_00695 [Bdellovibrionales bacterium]
MSDVQEFGNSELAVAAQGSIKIKLRISGIDDPSLRSEVEEALTDKRFFWNVDELMASIKSGELVLSGINPVKASVLINRLKPVKVQLYWEQYVLQVQKSTHSPIANTDGELESSWSQEVEQPDVEEPTGQSIEGAEKLASQSSRDSDWTRQITKLNSRQEKVEEYKRIITKLIQQKKNAPTFEKNKSSLPRY